MEDLVCAGLRLERVDETRSTSVWPGNGVIERFTGDGIPDELPNLMLAAKRMPIETTGAHTVVSRWLVIPMASISEALYPFLTNSATAPLMQVCALSMISLGFCSCHLRIVSAHADKRGGQIDKIYKKSRQKNSPGKRIGLRKLDLVGSIRSSLVVENDKSAPDVSACDSTAEPGSKYRVEVVPVSRAPMKRGIVKFRECERRTRREGDNEY